MKRGLFIVSILFFTSCANSQHNLIVSQKVAINFDKDVPNADITNHFFLGGIFQSEETDTYAICNSKGFSKVEAVVTEQRWYQSFLHFASFGIYSPRKTYIWCK